MAEQVAGWLNRTHVGDCRQLLPRMAENGIKVQTCVTSPPYFGLRDYGVDGQIGLEPSPAEYVEALVTVFRLVREALSDDGTVWLNLGDSYASGGRKTRDPGQSKIHPAYEGGAYSEGLRPDDPPGIKPKDLLGIPWRVAFALQADGWYLRSDIIWHKPNPMPESVVDRPTKAHEYLFLLSKAERYYYDNDSIRESHAADAKKYALSTSSGGLSSEGYDVQKWSTRSDGLSRPPMTMRDRQYNPLGRNRRTVWTIPTAPFSDAHFATFPRALIEPCILAGARPGNIVLDPFMGSGTTGQVATDLGRQFIGCELNPEYVELHEMRRTTIGMPV